MGFRLCPQTCKIPHLEKRLRLPRLFYSKVSLFWTLKCLLCHLKCSTLHLITIDTHCATTYFHLCRESLALLVRTVSQELREESDYLEKMYVYVDMCCEMLSDMCVHVGTGHLFPYLL